MFQEEHGIHLLLVLRVPMFLSTGYDAAVSAECQTPTLSEIGGYYFTLLFMIIFI